MDNTDNKTNTIVFRSTEEITRHLAFFGARYSLNQSEAIRAIIEFAAPEVEAGKIMIEPKTDGDGSIVKSIIEAMIRDGHIKDHDRYATKPEGWEQAIYEQARRGACVSPLFEGWLFDHGYVENIPA